MKLLVITQKVDKNDSVLGFFHRWLEEFARHVEQMTVICLERGEHRLPGVKVLSLGKEGGRPRLKYVWRFYKYIWQERKNYEAVFVHMNQEYILLAGWLWFLLGKRIYLWRNYHYGNLWTRLAVAFCARVFCTSAFSYTARFKKTILMPVGVETNFFVDKGLIREEKTILSLGRLAADKRLDILLEAVAKVPAITKLDFFGDELPRGLGYLVKLKELSDRLQISSKVSFNSGIPNDQTVDVYNEHEIFVNLSPSGMYDKTIFEAGACGCLVISSSSDWGKIADQRLYFDGTAVDLAKKIATLVALSKEEKALLVNHCKSLSKQHSLGALGDRLVGLLY